MNKEDSFIVSYLTSGPKGNNKNREEAYSIITNRDGSIRWAYPSDLKAPTFLNFYSSSSFRSRVYSTLVSVLFLLRLSRLVKLKEATFLIDEDSILHGIISRYPDYTHSIFTGTVGVNRKVIIELSEDYKPLVFAKIAISEQSKSLINNEFSVLTEMNNKGLASLNIPEVLYYDNKNGILEISNIKPEKYTQPSRLVDAHVVLLDTISSHHINQLPWSDMSVHKEIRELVAGISCQEYDNGLDKSRVDIYLGGVKTLLDSIAAEKIFNCGLSHGDFTPWNMYLMGDDLYVYDWELSKNSVPLLFDMFHFIFQSEIMIHHSDYKSIKNEIIRVLSLESSSGFVSKYSIDINAGFIFYITYISTYYLGLYVKQNDLHSQVFWLLDIWEHAVKDLVDNNGVIFDEK